MWVQWDYLEVGGLTMFLNRRKIIIFGFEGPIWVTAVKGKLCTVNSQKDSRNWSPRQSKILDSEELGLQILGSTNSRFWSPRSPDPRTPESRVQSPQILETIDPRFCRFWRPWRFWGPRSLDLRVLGTQILESRLQIMGFLDSRVWECFLFRVCTSKDQWKDLTAVKAWKVSCSA